MKVLQVNCVYQKGSTGKIVYDIHTQLNQESIDSIVCYGRGRKISEPNVYKVCGEFYAKLNNFRSRITGIMYGGASVSTHRVIAVIKKENPDIVHMHCINGYFVNIYRLVAWLKKNNIKTVLTLHAEFMYTGGCGYALDCEKWNSGCGNCLRLKAETKSILFDGTHIMWKHMKKAFDGFENNLAVISVSPWLLQRAKRSLILGDKKHQVILNGLDTNVFKVYDASELKEKHGITNEKIIFHVTPYFCDDPQHIKGGYYILQLAEMMKDKNIKIIVAGKYDSNITIPENVIMLGIVSEQCELAEYYSMANVSVLTSKKETFSMVVAESLCCGTPVVGFEAGAPEQITLPEYSDFVEYGALNELRAVTEKWLYEQTVSEVIREAAKEKYAKERMASNYIDIYSKMKEGNW